MTTAASITTTTAAAAAEMIAASKIPAKLITTTAITTTNALSTIVKPSTTATRTTTKAKKTCTTILCELTRLKSQQKYLECNQVKLNPDNFADYCDDEKATAALSTSSIKQFITEIEQLKSALHEDLNAYRDNIKQEVEDIWLQVNDIRKDISVPSRLKEFSLTTLRERIIAINTQLSRLSAKNAKQLSDLQQECLQLEEETRVLLK